MNGNTSLRAGAWTDVLRQPVPDAEWRRLAVALATATAITAGIVAAWAATAPLAGAVVAPAQLKVELNRKTVQHQEGGIVREILVRNGQPVHAGDALLVVADVRHESDLSLLTDQWLAARVRAARADAESRLAVRFEPPDDLRDAAAAAAHLARERTVFATRRRALDEQAQLIGRQIREAEAQARALQSQIDATAQSGALSEEELAINRRLAGEGFVNHTRVIALERVAADYRSRVAEQRGDLAAAQQRIAELQARIAQLRLTHQSQAIDEMNEATVRVRELGERLKPSQDQVERQIVRAPVDGRVMSVRVAGAGAVVGPRDPLLDVVPEHEKLVVEARIAPQDIEHVRAGRAAHVRLLSADARLVPLLPGTLTFVSADRVTPPEPGRAWFDATVEVDAAALRRHPSALLTAGMPAEVYVTTGERTLLEYLVKPLRVFSQRAMREPG
jgi:HlyD family type I secretion membrane fusion protein